jgi:hypothetical protein
VNGLRKYSDHIHRSVMNLPGKRFNPIGDGAVIKQSVIAGIFIAFAAPMYNCFAFTYHFYRYFLGCLWVIPSETSIHIENALSLKLESRKWARFPNRVANGVIRILKTSLNVILRIDIIKR